MCVFADGVPGAMSNLAVSPVSQTSVVVRWVPPFESNVEDSALLNYQLFYHEDTQDSVFDISTAQSPQDNSLVIFPDKSSALFDFSTGEFEVTGLSVGTRYLFCVQASSSVGAGDRSPVSSVATYGLRKYIYTCTVWYVGVCVWGQTLGSKVTQLSPSITAVANFCCSVCWCVLNCLVKKHVLNDYIVQLQWNLSNPDTLGTKESVLIREVSSFQG